ncbi:MAG: hypothetical protein JKY98_03910 [Gammaproteobacteria bacterium]|nr:hypothetical protein [Gammaproteobacteria bacterium]
MKDYVSEFGGSVSPSCMKCLNKYYNNFINKYSNMGVEKHHGFVLKGKYNGIKSSVTGRPYRNGDLTEKQATELIEKHPHGRDLFASIPASYDAPKKVEKKKVVKKSKK